MPQTLALFGATGQQGSSVINYILNDPELSQKYKLRAITRDINSDKSKQLKEKNIEVVQGDVLDRASIETALTGAQTVFVVTTPSFSPDAVEIEFNNAKTVADVAVEKGVEYIIFSTLPSISEISSGKYTKVTAFDAKAKAEQYIRGLPIKSAFFSGAFFMENFVTQPFLAPQKAADGTWVMARPNSPKTLVPYIDAVGDIGKFVGAILAEPDKYEGKISYAVEALYSFEEIAAIISKATGKTVVYKQISVEDFRNSMPLPPALVDVFTDAFEALQEFGYWGLDTEKLVTEAAEKFRGRLSSLGDYFEAHPLHLA